MLQCSCSSSGMALISSSSCCVKFSMGSSMGEEAMSISSAGEVWTADASGDALDNVAFGDALGDTDVAGTFAEEGFGRWWHGGVRDIDVQHTISQLLLERTKFPFAFVFLQLDGDLSTFVQDGYLEYRYHEKDRNTSFKRQV